MCGHDDKKTNEKMDFFVSKSDIRANGKPGQYGCVAMRPKTLCKGIPFDSQRLLISAIIYVGWNMDDMDMHSLPHILSA